MRTIKKALILAILAMFVASVAVVPASIQSAVAQNEGPGRIAAEKLIVIVEKGLARAKAIIAASESTNVTTPQAAKDQMAQAEALLAEAKNSLASGDVRAAIEKAIESMKHIREALKLAILPPEEREEAKEAVKIVGLSNAINRTKLFIAKLQNMTDTLEQRGLNVTAIDAQLIDASNHLAQAEQLLSQDDLTGAAREHGIAQSIAARVLHDIREAAKPEKRERIKEFADKFEKRLGKFEEKLDKLLDKIQPEARERIRDHIIEAKARLNATREDIRHGDFEKAIDKLEDTLERLERAAERLEEQKPVIGERLEKAVQALQVNLEKLENRTHAAEGKVAEKKLAEVKEKLEELKQKLEEIKQDIKNGQLDDAAEKIGKIQEKIDELAEKLNGNGEHAKDREKEQGKKER